MLFFIAAPSSNGSDEAKPVPNKRGREGGTCT